MQRLDNAGADSLTKVPLQLRVALPGQKLDDLVNTQIETLFNASYYRYHFKEKLFDVDRTRILMLDQHQNLVGFGTIMQSAPYAVLSNLLVNDTFRGLGIGSRIEEIRMAIVDELGLVPYSSCVTVGVQSQRLKQKHGLVPINYKLGNRIDVILKGNVSSAVSYLGVNYAPLPVYRNDIQFDAYNDRTRLVCAEQSFLDAHLDKALSRTDAYVDLLTAPGVEVPNSFVMQGFDLDLPQGRAGILWQYDNVIRKRGASGSLDLLVPLDQVVRQAAALLEDAGSTLKIKPSRFASAG